MFIISLLDLTTSEVIEGLSYDSRQEAEEMYGQLSLCVHESEIKQGELIQVDFLKNWSDQ